MSLDTAGLPAFERESASHVPTSHLFIGPYELVSRFHSSQINEVYLGVERSAAGYGARAVIKLVRRDAPQFARNRELLIDEARALAILHHPNVVRILSCGDEETGSYLAIEYIDGADFGRVLTSLEKRGLRLSAPIAVFVTIELLRALSHAHTATDASGNPLHLIHRDVSPSNVLISKQGSVVLTDFGMVKMIDRIQKPTEPGLVKGKSRYLAPEYLRQESIDHRIDVYGAGVVLFELLIGRKWTDATVAMTIMRRIVNEGLPHDLLNSVRVPKPFVNIVRRATDRDVSRRYNSAAQFMDSLEEAMSHAGHYASHRLLAAEFERAAVFPRKQRE